MTGKSYPFAPVHRHVRRLLRVMTYAEIGNLADLPRPTVSAIGLATPRRPGLQRRFVTGYVAERLLAVQPPKTRATFNGCIPVEGTRRRVQAIAVTGGGIKWQAREGGMSYRTLERIARITGPDAPQWCTPQIADAVDLLYQRLDRYGMPEAATPHIRLSRKKAAAAAQARGWRGPDAWDEETIDDPSAEPYAHLRLGTRKPPKDTVSPSTVWVALGGGSDFSELTLAERVEVVTILAARQWSDDRIGEHLRASGDAVAVFRTRHGIASHYQPIAAYAA